MDVRMSAAVDDVAKCLDESDVREPSVSTMLMNFGNNFDPYGALSTPLYQTATFKQNVSKAIERVAISLGAMVGRLGHEKDQSNKREQLDDVLDPFGLPLTTGVCRMTFGLKAHLLDAFCGFIGDEGVA